MMINNVLRSAQKTGGLFDTELGKLTDNAEKKTIFDADLWDSPLDLSLLAPAAVGGSGFGGMNLWGTGIGDEDMLLDENSLDQYMDLSQFLIQETLPLDLTLDSIAVDSENTATAAIKKRKSVLGDHDYVIKCPRMALPVEDKSPAVQLSSVHVRSSPPKDKYRERRQKNNIASRRSRETRKQKYLNMETESDVLLRKNEHLEKKIVEMEALAKEMKAALVTKLVARK